MKWFAGGAEAGISMCSGGGGGGGSSDGSGEAKYKYADVIRG